MKHTFKELVDIPRLQELTDELYRATGIPSAIITTDGEVLTGSGWQRICTSFHRCLPETERDYVESDTRLFQSLTDGERYAIYECPRGLVDACSPVVIDGQHMANVFAGQLFMTPPDAQKEQFFREQARRFGFDEDAYMAAFRDIPVLSEQRFRPALDFLAGFAELVASIGLSRKRELAAAEEHQQLQRRLQQSQKLEALGTLAGGIAHDFNNILAGILGYTELVLLEPTLTPQMQADLQKIVQGCHRARDLVGQILAFSRHTDSEQRPFEPVSLAKEALTLLRASIPTSIAINTKLHPDAGQILGNPSQFHQVLMNLCTNAAQAMADGAGTLDIQLGPAEVDAAMASKYPELDPGPYVRLCIRDDGEGIDPALGERIFDPFFTTRSPGQGTGLGLSVVHGIVRSHKGAITYESQPGRGSCFCVYFPRLKDHQATSRPQQELPLGGSESILLVDDEPTLRELGRRMLEGLGYRVTAFGDGHQALQAFLQDPLAYDLIISDQTMPHATGLGLASEVHHHRPGLPIILCTGYSEQTTPERLAETGIAALVQKPYSRQRVARLIRRVLDPGS